MRFNVNYGVGLIFIDKQLTIEGCFINYQFCDILCLKLINSDSDDSIDIDNKSGKNDLEYGPSDKKGAECKQCFGTAEKNKNGTVEPLIHCSKCLTICKINILICMFL